MLYETHVTKDNAAALSKKLNEIGARGGAAVSVMWKPERQNAKDKENPHKSAYVIVAAFAKAKIAMAK